MSIFVSKMSPQIGFTVRRTKECKRLIGATSKIVRQILRTSDKQQRDQRLVVVGT